MFRKYLLIGCLLTAACSQSAAPDNTLSSAPSRDRPNIVLILADDLGYGDIGAFGQTQIATPNLDRMAAEGLVLTDFYAGSTVCAPSRSVLMTGLHTGHTPIRGNATSDIQTLAPEDVTVAEVLKGAGYRTVLLGKWGLGDVGNTGRPNDQGFDSFFGYLNQVHAHNHYPAFLWENEERVSLPNKVRDVEMPYVASFTGGIATERNVYADDLFAERAVSELEESGNGGLFLFLSLISPHANNEADLVEGVHGMEIPSLGAYRDRDWPETEKAYAAMVGHIDETVGRILDTVSAAGQADNTIVIFTSDNGPHAEGGFDPAFFGSSGPLRGIKRDLTEGGIRVPTIIWAPGRAAAGGRSDFPGYFADFMPTAAHFAGVASPPTDGIDLSGVILGSGEPDRDSPLYWEFYVGESSQAIRDGRWKAIRSPMHDGPLRLYDLSADIGEARDLAPSHPEQADRLGRLMDAAHEPDPRWERKGN